MSSPPQFKIILAGDSGTGKTSFVRQRQGFDFVHEYTSTYWINKDPIVILTNSGPVIFNIWDLGGQRQKEFREFYKGADGAIIMFDLTRADTYKNVDKWRRQILKVCPNIPIIICGNKNDLPNHIQIKEKDSKEIYTDISVKYGTNCISPLLSLVNVGLIPLGGISPMTPNFLS